MIPQKTRNDAQRKNQSSGDVFCMPIVSNVHTLLSRLPVKDLEVVARSGSCDVAFSNSNGKELPEREVGFS